MRTLLVAYAVESPAAVVTVWTFSESHRAQQRLLCLGVLALFILIGAFFPGAGNAQTNECPTDIRVGDVVHCSIDQPGSQRTHRFMANQGDGLKIVVESANVSPHIEVLRPNGTLSCGPGWGDLSCEALDTTGNHTVLVKDEEKSKTGSYTLRLSFAAGRPIPSSTPPGGTPIPTPTLVARVSPIPTPDDDDNGDGPPWTQIVVAIIGALATIIAAWLTTRRRGKGE